MMLRAQKDVQNGQPLIEPADAILFEQFFKLLFFLLVDGMCRHGYAPACGPGKQF